MSGLLEKVNSPADLKKLPGSMLPEYAAEVRAYILKTVTERGGHLSSNLGAVELTIALHYVFDSPKDKLIFDVGHQTYTHKIITGRRELFAGLRTDEGVSGFPSPRESEHDHFTTGHSSTSLSLGLGLARARKVSGEDYRVVCVIGDGAFTGGMALEALNDIGANHERMIIVLNDNKMSISRNVGAFSEYFARLRLSKRYASAKMKVKKGLSALPFFGDEVSKVLDKAKRGVKFSILHNQIFENLGIKYYGPFDGHDVNDLVSIFRRLRDTTGPVLVHLVTRKGNGDAEVMERPDLFHGVGPAGACKAVSFASIVGEKLCELAKRDERVVAVTAAMSMGTGLEKFAADFRGRYYDVGIAEEHAVSMCAGLAAAGMKPYFAVYSSFLQRAFDQTLHDICIDGRPVTLLVDHAGVVGGDGVTHQGLYDIAYLSMIPGLTLLQPKDAAELGRMLEFSLFFGAPLAIRYPKSCCERFDSPHPFTGLDWEIMREGKKGAAIILASGGKCLSLALTAKDVTVVNARVLKPLDESFLSSVPKGATIITLEEGILRGGFGESVAAYYRNLGKSVRVIPLGFPDEFLRSTDEEKLYASAGLTPSNLEKLLNDIKRGSRAAVSEKA